MKKTRFIKKYFSRVIHVFIVCLLITACQQPSDGKSLQSGVSIDTLGVKRTIDSLINLGVANGGRGYKSSIRWVDSASLLANDLNSKQLNAYCNINKAKVFANFRHFDSTLYYVNKSLQYYSTASYSADQVMGFLLASDVYTEMAKYELATEYYERALRVSECAKDTLTILKVKVYGLVFLARQKKFEECIALARDCENLICTLPSSYEVSLEHNNIYNNMAATYASVGKIDSSELYFSKSLSIAKERNDSMLTSFIYDNMSRINRFKNQNQLALKYSDSAQHLLNGQKPRFYGGFLRNRIIVQKRLGRTDECLVATQLLITELDSNMARQKRLMTDELFNHLEELNYSYKILQVEKDKLQAEKQLVERNYLLLIASLMVLLLLMAFYFVRKRTLKRIEAENVKAKAAQEKLVLFSNMQSIRAEHVKREAVMLEKQHIGIQLHNTVANQLAAILFRIRNTDSYQKVGEIEGKLQGIYEELRSIIESEEYINRESLFSDVESFRSFVYSYFDKLPIEVEVVTEGKWRMDNIPAETIIVVSTSLKELFVNALKYSNCTLITIRIKEEINKVVIEVSDNGIGFNIHCLKPNKPTGLLNVKQEIELLPFGTFKIESSPKQGTRVRFSFAK